MKNIKMQRHLVIASRAPLRRQHDVQSFKCNVFASLFQPLRVLSHPAMNTGALWLRSVVLWVDLKEELEESSSVSSSAVKYSSEPQLEPSSSALRSSRTFSNSCSRSRTGNGCSSSASSESRNAPDDPAERPSTQKNTRL